MSLKPAWRRTTKCSGTGVAVLASHAIVSYVGRHMPTPTLPHAQRSILVIAAATALAALTRQAWDAAAMPRPSAHTKGSPTGKPTGPLKPGEYWWNPQVSPEGPIVVLVSLPLQTMHVYRNGILVGRSSVSSGSKGHKTPTGVFTILEKKQTHRSKKYDNAPMPHMQRLTWSGIAMHSGNLPGSRQPRLHPDAV